jgi:hypothetical protein
MYIRRVGLIWLNPSAFGPNQLFRWKNIMTISVTIEGVSAPLPAASDF